MTWIHQVFDDDDSTPPHVLFPAPEQTNRDILRTRVRHMKSRVRVRIKLADLRRTGTFHEYDLSVVTNEGWSNEIAIYTGPGEWAGRIEADTYPRDTGCAIHRTLDYDTNMLVVGFARKCVSNPRWVRVSVGTSGGGDGDVENEYFYDDSQRKGLDPLYPDTWRYSPRVMRGSLPQP